MDEKFQQAEREYFALRGKFDAGRITREEFENALKEGMVQDEQGRYWILGLDSGRWYVHDGKDWAMADPPGALPGSPTARPDSAPALRAASATTRRSNRLPIIAAVGCLAIICLALVGVSAYIFLNPAAPRPTRAVLAPTTVLVNSPAPNVLPTPTRGQVVEVVPISTSEPTATPPPPTDTPVPTPVSSPTPAIRPGVYVSALETNPSKPARRQDIFFAIRFLNTTGNSRSYRWLVYVFKSDPSQRNSLGETPSTLFTFPAGTAVVEIGTWRLTGAGGCEEFIARVGWLDENRRPTLFAKPDGQVFEQSFTVCP